MTRIFNQGFLLFLFFLFFGLRLGGESVFGCPLTEQFFSIWISSSDKSYTAGTPLYPDGVYPARTSLLWVVPTVTGFLGVLIFSLISKTVNSIPSLYRQEGPVDQGVKCLYVQHSESTTTQVYSNSPEYLIYLICPNAYIDTWIYGHIDNLLHGRVVVCKEFLKISLDRGWTIDELLGQG